MPIRDSITPNRDSIIRAFIDVKRPVKEKYEWNKKDNRKIETITELNKINILYK